MEAARLTNAAARPEGLRLSLIGGLLGLTAVAWVMAAMMFPSVAPTVVMHSRVQAGKAARGGAAVPGGTAILLGGYLLA